MKRGVWLLTMLAISAHVIGCLYFAITQQFDIGGV
jgi:hypothetical protein